MSVSVWWRRNFDLRDKSPSLKIAGYFATSVWWRQASWIQNKIMEELLCGCEHSRGFVFRLWFLSLPSLLNLLSRKNNSSFWQHWKQIISSPIPDVLLRGCGSLGAVSCWIQMPFLEDQYANAFTYFMDKSGREVALELNDSFP